MASTDTAIMGSFIFFFLVLGIVAPLIQEDFNQAQTNPDVQGTLDSIEDEGRQVTALSWFKVLGSIITMPVWSFGNIPWSIDLIIITPIRVIFWLLIIRLIRGVG